MNNLKPLALLCTLFPLSGIVLAQETMTMPMSGHDMAPSESDASMKNMNDMPGMADMPSMDHSSKPKLPEQPNSPELPAPAVGSLPSSDGSAGKSFHVDGMNMDIMDMNDDPLIAKFMLDKLEYVHGDQADSLVWDGRFRLGYDINKLWIRSEGQRAHGKTQDADAELLWGHTVAAYWDVMSGIRHDFGTDPSRDWAALGIQGLAPYKFDVEATAYVGPSGRTMARLKTSYDLLLTQRLILTPEVDANLYTKEDLERGIGAGLSDTSLGLRLRYEIRREFAPYFGVNYVQKYGKTAALARTNGDPAHDLQFVAGVHMWF
ncbi:copper resistance protein B [Sulfuriferula nivalis]|uniref:Copper resistance protein B n=1 Tax=Sulfuriferula nivalis TaxID=2675298 RepID=A0A809S2Q5_9PROT|nr:copper resistance protein B [Sulfuriferula nivalis]BBP00958.1 copper resistance protein B [Sulfuriferula nivalis]